MCLGGGLETAIACCYRIAVDGKLQLVWGIMNSPPLNNILNLTIVLQILCVLVEALKQPLHVATELRLMVSYCRFGGL